MHRMDLYLNPYLPCTHSPIILCAVSAKPTNAARIPPRKHDIIEPTRNNLVWKYNIEKLANVSHVRFTNSYKFRS